MLKDKLTNELLNELMQLQETINNGDSRSIVKAIRLLKIKHGKIHHMIYKIHKQIDNEEDKIKRQKMYTKISNLHNMLDEFNNAIKQNEHLLKEHVLMPNEEELEEPRKHKELEELEEEPRKRTLKKHTEEEEEEPRKRTPKKQKRAVTREEIESAFVNDTAHVNRAEPLLILFYKPTCPYCVQFRSLWAELKNHYKEKNVKLFAVDCENTENKQLEKLLDKYDVQKFPTLIYSYKNKHKMFEGERTFERITDFVDSGFQ